MILGQDMYNQRAAPDRLRQKPKHQVAKSMVMDCKKTRKERIILSDTRKAGKTQRLLESLKKLSSFVRWSSTSPSFSTTGHHRRKTEPKVLSKSAQRSESMESAGPSSLKANSPPAHSSKDLNFEYTSLLFLFRQENKLKKLLSFAEISGSNPKQR